MIAIDWHRSLTSLTMCVERITMIFSPISLSRLWKRTRSSGSSPAVGSSTMISLGLPMQRLRDAEALLHAAGKRAERLIAGVPQIGLTEQRFDQRLARSARR